MMVIVNVRFPPATWSYGATQVKSIQLAILHVVLTTCEIIVILNIATL
jgi:hypothetical protein